MTMTPPRWAERLMRQSLPVADRCAVLGDLLEEFEDRCRRHGLRPAQRWYVRQVIRSLVANLLNRVETRVEILRQGRGNRMQSVWQDIRFTARTMVRRQPIAAVATLGSLIVGLTLCVTVFTLYNAIASKTLPLERPDELAVLVEWRGASAHRGFSYRDFTEFSTAAQRPGDAAAFSAFRATVARAGGSETAAGEFVSDSYFSVLRPRLRWGRPLTPADLAARLPVAVVSFAFWQRMLPGVEPSAQSIVVNRQPLTIVGVTDAPFNGVDRDRPAELWVPVSTQRSLDGSGQDLLAPGAANWLRIVYRLRAGTTLDRAAADIAMVEAGLERTPNRPVTRQIGLLPGARGDSTALVLLISPLRLLLVGCGLLLLIACGNSASLLATRVADRRGEFAVRLALGAGHFRVIRLLLVEAWIHGSVAILASLVLSPWMLALAVPFLPGPMSADLTHDVQSLTFAGLAGLLASSLSVLPALFQMRRRLTGHFVPRSVAGAGVRSNVRRVLVGAQFAVTFGLVVAGMMLGRTLVNLRTMPMGFDLDRVGLLSIDLSQSYDQARARQYYERALARVRAMPGVEEAAVGRVIPLAGGGSRTGLSVPGYVPARGESLETNYNQVSGGYFAAMGIPIVAGRSFDASDTPAARTAGIVNETMAKRFWTVERAIGQTFRLGDGSEVTVVGVVADAKYRAIREELRASFYLAVEQAAPLTSTLHVRFDGAPRDRMNELRQIVAVVDPAVPVTRVRTLREQADLSLANERLAMTIGGTTGAAAVMLAAVSLFATFSYSVSRRRKELGLRLALGASPALVGRMVVRDAVELAAVGSLCGSVLGWALGRLLDARLYGVTPTDFSSFAATALLLGGAAIAASIVPAWRAAQVDAATVLREG